MSRYYDRQGNNIPADDFYELNLDRGYRIVGRDEFGAFTVSTVWLGIDHGLGNRVIIFESMVFCDLNDGDWMNPCCRYSTEKEAEDGHQRYVEHFRRIHDALESICSCPVVKDDD